MVKFGTEEATAFAKHFATFLAFSLIGWLVSWLNLSLVGVLFVCAIFAWRSTFEESKQLQKKKTQLFFKNEKEAIREIFEEIPRWIYFPDIERAEWLNKVATRIWPDVTFYAKEFLKNKLEPNIQKSLPDKLKNFCFKTIDLGDKPPRITGVKVYTRHLDEDEIIMDVNVFYAGDARVSVKLSKFEAGVKDIQFKGTLRVVLKPLLRYPPFIGGIQIYFLTYPMLDFDLTDVASVLQLPGLYSLLQKALLSQIANYLIIPNKITVSLSQDVDPSHLKFIEPKGVLMVRLLEAKNLIGHDLTSKSDPYVKTTVATEERYSKVKKNTHNPVWEDELYHFTVLEVSGVNLQLEVYDKDHASQDDLMGRVSIPLTSLMKRGHADTWSDLADGEGCIHYIATWYSPTSDSSLLKSAAKESARKPSAMLSVYVDSAKNLQSFDGESSQPSSKVVLAVGSDEKCTNDVLTTANPAYYENFHFLVKNTDLETLTMKVCEVDSDDVYGSASILLSNIVASGEDMTIYRFFPLRGGPGSSELLVRLSVKYLVPSNELKKLEGKAALVADNNGNVVEADTAGGVAGSAGAASTAASTAGAANTVTSTAGAASTAASTAGAANTVTSTAGAASTVTSTTGAASTAKRTTGNTSKPATDETVPLVDAVVTTSPSTTESNGTELRRRKPTASEKDTVRAASSKELGPGDIELTVSYKQSSSKLEVIVHRCRELMRDVSPSVDDEEAPDIYVKLYLMPDKSNKCKTDVCKESFYPVFDESFEFPVEFAELMSTSVEITVKHVKSFFSKVELGHLILPLRDVPINKAMTRWYPLVQKMEDSN